MTEWPKNPRVGSTPEPQGPLNVFNEALASADAINRANATKDQYDQTHPGMTAVVPLPAPAAFVGVPIGTGSPITVDESKYMIDIPVQGRRRR